MIEEKFNIESYLRAAKDKYTYFLLAASASAIAFSVTQTKGDTLAWSQLPLAIAVLCWASSFYFGCRCAFFYQKLLQDSADLYGSQNTMNNMPETKEQVIELIGESYYQNLVVTDSSSKKQFVLLLFGGLFFIGWHVTEMYLRAINVT